MPDRNLGDWRLALTPGDPQLRHLDRAWASTVYPQSGSPPGY